MSRSESDPAQPMSYRELELRLEEAEETLRAIREGEIDALVVRPSSSEEVFTLHGGKDSYHAFMETMDHGAAALGSRGEILYANSVLSELLGVPLAQLQGTALVDRLDPATGEQVAALLERTANGSGEKQSIELALELAGETRHYLASAAPLQTGVVSGWAVTFTDLTDRVRAEKSIAAERAARAIIASANEAVIVCDAEGRITHTNAAVGAVQGGDLLGRPFHEAIRLKFADAIGLVQSEELVKMAIGGKAVQGIEAHAPDGVRVKDLLISAAPLSPSDGASSGCVITLVDLSQRKAAEKQQFLLMAELDHRVKNTLTLVLSILGRTSENNIDDFRTAFSGRIHALAATHNLLAAKSWSTLTLADIVTAEMAPFVGQSSGRVRFQDLGIEVKPRAAIALGLVFHELVTNAAKYGALSGDAGGVLLSASRPEKAGPAIVEWVESGGPKVTKPSQTGFGKTVILRSLQYSPDGGAELDFDPAGVRCQIRIPPEDIVAINDAA